MGTSMPAAPIRRTVRRLFVAAWIAASVALVAPVRAQAPDQPEPEALGAELARELLSTADFESLLVRELTRPEFARSKGLDTAPGWRARLQAAAAEEVADQASLLEQKAGHLFALTFTTDELRAINAFLKRPGGQALLAHLGGVAAGQAPPPPSGQARAEIEEFLATPEGASFRTKVEGMGHVADALKDEMVDALTPGVVRRFNDMPSADNASPPYLDVTIP